MNNMKMVSFRLMILLLSLLNYETAAPQGLPSTAGVETPVRVDLSHPIKLGENYPSLSRRKGEEGLSVVRIEVDSDGVVRAMQLVVSSGFARLDEASLDSFAGARLIPATIDGAAVNTWANIPIAWNLAGHSTYRPHRVNDAEIQMPIIQKSYRLKVSPDDYPSGSRATHQEGDCVIHAQIDKGGIATEISVVKSTGFAALDQGCIRAIREAPFSPARRDGEAVDGSATIGISWRLSQ
jgi:TonB family protein